MRFFFSSPSNECQQHTFLWRYKQTYPLIITKYTPYLFFWFSEISRCEWWSSANASHCSIQNLELLSTLGTTSYQDKLTVLHLWFHLNTSVSQGEILRILNHALQDIFFYSSENSFVLAKHVVVVPSFPRIIFFFNYICVTYSESHQYSITSRVSRNSDYMICWIKMLLTK